MKVILTAVFLFVLVSCKKKKEETKQSFIRFTYNGKVYNLISDPNGNSKGGGGYCKDNFNGVRLCVSILDPSVFGGRLIFAGNNCAYMGDLVRIFDFRNCVLKDINGNNIDSVNHFYYESGILNISETNCKTERKYDIVTAQYYDLSYCTISGTFNLILTNKNNAKIVLSDGEFYNDKVAK